MFIWKYAYIVICSCLQRLFKGKVLITIHPIKSITLYRETEYRNAILAWKRRVDEKPIHLIAISLSENQFYKLIYHLRN